MTKTLADRERSEKSHAVFAFTFGRSVQPPSDPIFRTAEPWSIGSDVSSGCIRMFNEDIIDLYRRVPIGTSVLVLEHISDRA